MISRLLIALSISTKSPLTSLLKPIKDGRLLRQYYVRGDNMNLDDKVAVITEKIHDKERPSTTGCVFPPVRSARQSTCLWSLTSILTASPKNGFVRKAASSREPSAISVPLPASSSNFPTFLTMHLIFCPRERRPSLILPPILPAAPVMPIFASP